MLALLYHSPKRKYMGSDFLVTRHRMSNYIGERARAKAHKHSQECPLKSFTMPPVKSGKLIAVVVVLGRTKNYVKKGLPEG